MAYILEVAKNPNEQNLFPFWATMLIFLKEIAYKNIEVYSLFNYVWK